jgi:tetratricopeptide (TPR) repeat protein
VALLDLATGKELAVLPGDQAVPVRFDAAGRLLTRGQTKLLEWPVQKNILSGLLRYGPPRILGPATVWSDTGVSADARVLALARPGRCALLLHRDRPGTFIELAPQDDVRYCDVSLDGQWVVTGSHNSQSVFVKVWDGRTGKHVKDLPVHGHGDVRFSRDGRWMATTGGGCRLWTVGSWQEGPKISGEHFAFSPDSHVLAVGDGFGVVHLYDPNTGREHARLEVGRQARSLPQCFTPDGAHLIASNSEDGTTQIWNLAAIRAQLAELGLDWDSKSIPPAPVAGYVPPLQVEVDKGELGMTQEQRRSYGQRQAGINSLLLALNPWNFQALLERAGACSRLGDHARAIDDYNQALLLLPLQRWDPVSVEAAAQEFNYWAWRWARYTPKSDGGPKALALARKAVELQPTAWMNRNTLGVVYYRLGDYQNARANLERSLHDSAGAAAAFDLFFLAMCHQRLRNAGKAHECYDQVVRWVGKEKADLPAAWIEELKILRAEADQVLEISGS